MAVEQVPRPRPGSSVSGVAMPSYRSFLQYPPWRRLVLASTCARLPMTMAIFGLVLAGRALGSFALGGRLAAVYTLTGAATAMWRGRHMDRGDLRLGLRRDGVVVAALAAGIAVAVAAHSPALVVAGLAFLLGLAMAAIPGGYRALVTSGAPPGELNHAYALDAVCVEVCFVAGPAVAAAVAWFGGPKSVFALMALTALLGAVMVGRLAPAEGRGAEPGEPAPAPFRVPAMVGALVAAIGVGMAIGVEDATYPPLAVAFGSRAALGGVFVTLMALGSATSGLLLGPRVALSRQVTTRAVCLVALFGVAVLPVAAAPGIAAAIPLALIAGAPFALMVTSASVLIQRTVARERSAEAFSMLNAGLLVGNAVGSAVVSATIGPAGARATMLIAGAGPLLAATGLFTVMAMGRRRAQLRVAAM
ncbi:MAG TPA: MFS transporter [Acidimicrobiales bacterium]|nr:MFS transporter [Acidimicrobiales bacterium]